MKRIISIILSVVSLFTFSFPVYAVNLASNTDLSQDRLEVVSLSDKHELVYYNDTIIEDITTDTYREITTQSGSDISVLYEDLSTGLATLSKNGRIVDTYDLNDMRRNVEKWEIPEEDLLLLDKCLLGEAPNSQVSLPKSLQNKYTITYDIGGNAVISSNETENSRSIPYNIVRPDGPVTATYPEYTYRTVNSRSVYSAYCNKNLDMSIKDSMCNYVQISKDTYKFAADTAISLIAATLRIASGTLMSTLSGYITVVAGVLVLSARVEYYFSEAYRFYAIRQAYVYDYTYNNRYVSVFTESGSGQISLTWDYVNNEYTDPAYRISALAYPLTLSYDYMYDTALEIWDYNISEYGYWSWGDT